MFETGYSTAQMWLAFTTGVIVGGIVVYLFICRLASKLTTTTIDGKKKDPADWWKPDDWKSEDEGGGYDDGYSKR